MVVPWIEQTYPAQSEPAGRLLLGFSKSGWGAWSLLLRHPEILGRAAAWDAPLMMARMGRYGTEEIFGTETQFEKYRIGGRLRANPEPFRNTKRLILTGHGNFREQHQRAAKLLRELNLPHEYRDGPQRKHNWHGGWLSEAVELLTR